VAQALVMLRPSATTPALAAALADQSLQESLRAKIGSAIATDTGGAQLECLREAMQLAPTRLQGTLAETLTGDLDGASALLTLVETGQVAPRVLMLPAISNKLAALKSSDLDARAAAITAKLPPPNAIVDALIIERRRSFARAKTNAEHGKALFTKHCAACHQVGGQGAVVGPQLDGIVGRGIDRLLEDVLDPNRNVDVAFRTTTLRLADGRVLSGLVRRDEGEQLVLADVQGKEFTVAKSDIDEQQKTPLSLMPANVGETLQADELADLLAWLLTQRAAPRE
jgi:putative heme-binding domain-containing protein